MNLQITNVLKIADIDAFQLDKETLKWFDEKAEILYKDQVLREDIYNISDFMENIDDLDCSEHVKTVIEDLAKAVDKKKCSYLRIVYN